MYNRTNRTRDTYRRRCDTIVLFVSDDALSFLSSPCEQNLMQLLGENVTDNHIQELIEEVDRDGDGR